MFYELYKYSSNIQIFKHQQSYLTVPESRPSVSFLLEQLNFQKNGPDSQEPICHRHRNPKFEKLFLSQ